MAADDILKSDTNSPGTLLKQGAEGKLYIGNYNGARCLVKERFSKKYRHPDLDVQLTRQRIKAEQKAFERCKAAGVETPKLMGVDIAARKIFMEYLDQAKTAKQLVDEAVLEGNMAKVEQLAKEIGRVVGLLHGHNIIHGDLTTSNMLLDPIAEEGSGLPYRLVMIDFGLSYHSLNVEDMGVDLYVLERALLSAHSEVPDFFHWVLESYRVHNKFKVPETIAKYEEVRARGRKRTMIG